MALSYSLLAQLFKTHPSWKLLRADNAPLIVAFVDYAFIQPNIRYMSQADLAAKLDDMLYQLRQTGGERLYPKSARAYLDDWAGNENGWLRKYYPDGSDEPHFDLTPATEKVLTWLEGLTNRTFVGTESRLLTIFDLLRQMVLGAETDMQTRIDELEKRKTDIEKQIAAIYRGDIPVLDETALKDRFLQFSTMARELLSDFRAVEHNFRQLDTQVREKIATWEGNKGALLDEIFGDRDMITDSDQGRSFRAFWDFLMSSRSQEEFSGLLEAVCSMDAVRDLTFDSRLRRIHFDWLEAGEHTQRTVAGLSRQLRRYLDSQAWLENRRIIGILDAIFKKAVAVKDRMPTGAFMTIDDPGPKVRLPMERLLYAPPVSVSVNSLIEMSDGSGIATDALFDQVYIDRTKLRSAISQELQTENQVLLRDVIRRHPLEKGLAELVAYLAIAGENRLTIFDETNRDEVAWRDDTGRMRTATVPRIIFNRI